MGAFRVPFVKTFCGKNILTDSLTAPVIDGEPFFFAFRRRGDDTRKVFAEKSCAYPEKNPGHMINFIMV